MEKLKKLWNSFKQLKTWQQVVIVILLLSLIGAIGGSGSSSSTTTNSASSDDAEVVADQTPPSKPAVSPAELKAALGKMTVKEDTVKGTKFYSPIGAPKYANANGFYIYIGQTGDSEPYLRFRIQYYGDDWLFIESFFFNVDGETFEISTSLSEMERDNDSSVWEWYDVAPTSENVAMLQKIMNSKKTVMRMEGSQYYKDKTINDAQKSAIKNTFIVYQGLGGTL
jgi:hypothetical protein